MAVTATITKDAGIGKSHSGQIRLTGKIVCTGTYATGGFAIDLSDYMDNVRRVEVSPSTNGYFATYDEATSKVKVLECAAAGSPAQEYGNTENMLETFYFTALGDNQA